MCVCLCVYMNAGLSLHREMCAHSLQYVICSPLHSIQIAPWTRTHLDPKIASVMKVGYKLIQLTDNICLNGKLWNCPQVQVLLCSLCYDSFLDKHRNSVIYITCSVGNTHYTKETLLSYHRRQSGSHRVWILFNDWWC